MAVQPRTKQVWECTLEKKNFQKEQLKYRNICLFETLQTMMVKKSTNILRTITELRGGVNTIGDVKVFSPLVS